MVKNFISSDIHGFYDQWIKALNKKGFDINNPDHHIIVLGDLFDRGIQAQECLDFVVKMIKAGRAEVILGNHEILLMDALKRGWFNSWDNVNKTNNTVYQLAGNLFKCDDDMAIEKVKHNKDLKFYFDNLTTYYETNNHIFVHGWLPNKLNWRSATPKEWAEATWLNGYNEWLDDRVADKQIVCGHIGSVIANEKIYGKQDFSPFINDKIAMIDGSVYRSNLINVIVIDDNKI